MYYDSLCYNISKNLTTVNLSEIFNSVMQSKGYICIFYLLIHQINSDMKGLWFVSSII